MSTLVRSICALALAAAVLPAPAVAASIEGLWLLQEGKAKIAIDRCGETVCGRIVTAAKIEANPDLLDKKNKDPALRQRKLKGLEVLVGFTGGPQEWTGALYNPDDGGTYRATIRVVDIDTLKVTGCLFRVLCKSTRLVRAPEGFAAG